MVSAATEVKQENTISGCSKYTSKYWYLTLVQSRRPNTLLNIAFTNHGHLQNTLLPIPSLAIVGWLQEKGHLKWQRKWAN